MREFTPPQNPRLRLSNRMNPSHRRAVFRGLAIVIGLGPLLGLELALRAGGWSPQDGSLDPYAGFSDVRPLFTLNQTGDRFEIAAARQPFFRPESFAAVKSSNEFRIFCLGGSTVQGNPYAIETSFTTWLELSLQAADPTRPWEVVNCGGISYASYRLAPILQEVLGYEPNLIVLYMGHNEFLEDRTYAHLRRIPRPIRNVHGWLASLRVYELARATWLQVAGTGDPATPPLPVEVDTRLDHPGGLESYTRDDAWKQAVVEHYEHNLHVMLEAADRAGVPVIVCNPAFNLKDCPPFKSQNRDDLSASEHAAFDRLWNAVREHDAADLDGKIGLLQQALAIDDRHAGAHYLVAECLRAAGRYAEAREAYLRAKEEDVCPLRMLEPMCEVVQRVVAETGTPLVDVRQQFEAQSPGGMPGEELFLDHVHPTISGHQQIADWLLAEMQRQDWVEISPAQTSTWEATRRRLYEEHWATLDAPYFARGQERLEGLRRWAQGRGFAGAQ